MVAARHPTAWGPRVLVVTAASSAFWATSWGPPQLTVGRVLLVALAAAIAVDLVPVRGRVGRPWWAVVAVGGAMTSLLAWSAVSAALWGCFCAGVVQGLGELVILAILVAIVGLYAGPRWALRAVGAATLGVVLGGVLAAVGLKDLHAATYSPTQSVSRLDGVYGNPNFLGTALALALPAAAAAAVRLGRWTRVAAVAVTLVLSGLLLATFSRGALLAAAVGVPVALLLASGWRPSRRTALVVGVAVPLLAAAFVLSPVYRTERLRADFGAAEVRNIQTADRSGWFPGQAGPVRVAGSELSNPPGTSGLQVVAARPEQGVSINLGQAFGTARAGWDFTVAHPGRGTAFELHWRVASLPSKPVVEGVVRVGAASRRVSARFDSRNGTRYVLHAWVTRPGTFVLDQVALYEKRPGTVGGPRPLPTRLLGPEPDRLRLAQSGYERSRWAAVRLAGDAFLERPIRGLGINRFSVYAAAHGTFGALPTHNTYAQVAAELGIIGLLPLIVAIATLMAAARSGRAPPLLRASLIGTLAVAAVDLLFVNGLSTPGMAMPLIVAIGLTAAWAGPIPEALGYRPPVPRWLARRRRDTPPSSP